MTRRSAFQNVAWIWEQFERGSLNLDPPYQRRSVWPLSYKSYLVETILLGYPMPAIYLFEEIQASGRSTKNVVDGKQRLLTISEFISGEFAIADRSSIEALRGKYFTDLADTQKAEFWSYLVLVEYLPSEQATLLDDIFDRINRNVIKLTSQELRHARLDGVFISAVEDISYWFLEKLPKDFPHFSAQQLRQMKEVEFVATLFMYLDLGPESLSQIQIDEYFILREEGWDRKHELEDLFRKVVESVKIVVEKDPAGSGLVGSRLRNVADFYSLFGAIADLVRDNKMPPLEEASSRLLGFVKKCDDPSARDSGPEVRAYYDAARSASNDKRQRVTRIEILKSVLVR